MSRAGAAAAIVVPVTGLVACALARAVLEPVAGIAAVAVVVAPAAVWCAAWSSLFVALRRPPACTPRRMVPNDTVEIVVRVRPGCPLADVRVTLIALGSRRRSHRVVVAVAGARPDVVDLAVAHGVRVEEADHRDRLMCRVRITAGTTWVGVLDAGDVPAPEMIEVLSAMAAADYRIGVVQGAVHALDERGGLGQHRLLDVHARSVAVGRALGRTGSAWWRGSGALFPRAAWDDLARFPWWARSSEQVASTRLLARGWRIVAPGAPAVVAAPAFRNGAVAARAIRREANATALAMLALVVPAQRPADLLVAARSSLVRFAALGRPWRAALPMLSLGAALALGARDELRPTVAGAFVFAAVVSAGLLTTSSPHRPLDEVRRTVASVLGRPAARLLGAGARRIAPRVPVEIDASLSGRAGVVVDLTEHGAGVLVAHAPPVGSTATLMLALPCATGERRGAVLACTIRHAEPRDGRVLVGVELVDPPADVADALAEWCRVAHPRRLLRAVGAGGGASISQSPWRERPPASPVSVPSG